MIARIWKGTLRASDADAYSDYIAKTGIKEYSLVSNCEVTASVTPE